MVLLSQSQGVSTLCRNLQRGEVGRLLLLIMIESVSTKRGWDVLLQDLSGRHDGRV